MLSTGMRLRVSETSLHSAGCADDSVVTYRYGPVLERSLGLGAIKEVLLGRVNKPPATRLRLHGADGAGHWYTGAIGKHSDAATLEDVLPRQIALQVQSCTHKACAHVS